MEALSDSETVRAILFFIGLDYPGSYLIRNNAFIDNFRRSLGGFPLMGPDADLLAVTPLNSHWSDIRVPISNHAAAGLDHP